ncbi:MAG: NADPH-dependent F420 reductase [Gemmatimonadaceae bacterium]
MPLVRAWCSRTAPPIPAPNKWRDGRPGARVVKAFNSIGREVMANPRFGTQRPVLRICGDDPEACDTVAALTEDIGFEPLRAGPLARARFVEPAALVWITSTAAMGMREFSRGLLRR